MDLKWKGKDAISLLLDTGLLFRINSEVLHPFGLAIGVITNKKDGIKEFGIFRSDSEEGMFYDDYGWSAGIEKYGWFLENGGYEKLNKRLREIGFIIQEGPIDEIFRKLGKYDC